MKNCVMSCLFFFLLTSVLAWNMYICDKDGYIKYLDDYAELGKKYPVNDVEFEERYSSLV